MKNGKSVCRVLKSVRQRIADANGISYRPAECHFEGDCSGTCPQCEAELRHIDRQLRMRASMGLPIAAVGVALGIGAMSIPATVSAQQTDVQPMAVETGDSLEITDLSNGQDDAILVRGRVLDKDSVEVIGASVMLKGTNRGVPTDLYGRFAVKIPPHATLKVDYIGYESVERTFDMSDAGVVIRMTEDVQLMGEVIVGRVCRRTGVDDVYGHQSHKKHKKPKK